VLRRTFGGAARGLFGENYATSDQQNAYPPLPRNVIVEKKLSKEGDEDIPGGCDWQHKAEVSAAEEGQVRQHPDRENADTNSCPRVCEGLDVVERGGGDDPSDLVHTMAQRHVADYVADHNDQDQKLSFAIAVGVHPTSGLREMWFYRLDTVTGLNHVD